MEVTAVSVMLIIALRVNKKAVLVIPLPHNNLVGMVAETNWSIIHIIVEWTVHMDLGVGHNLGNATLHTGVAKHNLITHTHIDLEVCRCASNLCVLSVVIGVTSPHSRDDTRTILNTLIKILVCERWARLEPEGGRKVVVHSVVERLGELAIDDKCVFVDHPLHHPPLIHGWSLSINTASHLH